MFDTASMELKREDMICIAMLTGSDYTTGIHSVGPVAAREIVKLFSGFDGLKNFKSWKMSLGRSDEDEVECPKKIVSKVNPAQPC
jgi:5'-3' exonuclease